MEEPIKRKNFDIQEDPPEVKKEVKKQEKHEENLDVLPNIKFNNDSLRKEHPELSLLYKALNEIIYDSLLAGNRSRDMRRAYDIKIEQQRKKIKAYILDNGITRDDFLRWDGFKK